MDNSYSLSVAYNINDNSYYLHSTVASYIATYCNIDRQTDIAMAFCSTYSSASRLLHSAT